MHELPVFIANDLESTSFALIDYEDALTASAPTASIMASEIVVFPAHVPPASAMTYGWKGDISSSQMRRGLSLCSGRSRDNNKLRSYRLLLNRVVAGKVVHRFLDDAELS